MNLKMFSVYDSKIEAYMAPIFCRTNGEALRRFEATAAQEDHDFNLHAADFTLMAVGEWDDEKGIITNYEANISLANALEFRNQLNPSAEQLKPATNRKWGPGHPPTGAVEGAQ